MAFIFGSIIRRLLPAWSHNRQGMPIEEEAGCSERVVRVDYYLLVTRRGEVAFEEEESEACVKQMSVHRPASTCSYMYTHCAPLSESEIARYPHTHTAHSTAKTPTVLARKYPPSSQQMALTLDEVVQTLPASSSRVQEQARR